MLTSSMSPAPIRNGLSTSPIASEDLASITGPVLLGGYLTWGLFGMLSIQVYTYYQSFPNDKLWTKTLVYAVHLLQLTHVVFVTFNGFRVFAYGFGDLDALDRIGTLWIPLCILEGVVAFLVQSFYAWRIYIISGKRFPTIFILMLSLFSFAWSIVVGINAAHKARFSNMINRTTYIESGFWEGSAAICDILIAAFMAYYLRRRIPAGDRFRGTADIVNKIVRLSIETGSLTATAAVVMLVTIYLSGNARADYVCPTTIIPGLYSTALLAVLNSRVSSAASCQSTTLGEHPLTNKPISIGDMFRKTEQVTKSDGGISSIDNTDATLSMRSICNKIAAGDIAASTTPCNHRASISEKPSIHYVGP